MEIHEHFEALLTNLESTLRRYQANTLYAENIKRAENDGFQQAIDQVRDYVRVHVTNRPNRPQPPA